MKQIFDLDHTHHLEQHGVAGDLESQDDGKLTRNPRTCMDVEKWDNANYKWWLELLKGGGYL